MAVALAVAVAAAAVVVVIDRQTDKISRSTHQEIGNSGEPEGEYGELGNRA